MNLKQRLAKLEQARVEKEQPITCIEVIDPATGEVHDALYLWPHPLFGQKFEPEKHARFCAGADDR